MISSEAKSLALVPKVTGGLSFFGSLFIVQEILRNNKHKQQPNNSSSSSSSSPVYHRIMLGLSAFDCLSSLTNILSTWPSPQHLDDSIYLASGNTATCTAQGFLAEVGAMSAVLYTASLTLRFVLCVCYGLKEHELKRYETYFHGVPISIGLIMGVAGLPLELYNNSGWLCWYAPYPAGCTQDNSCSRGELAPMFRWIHYSFVWTAIFFVTVGMVSIYLAVRKQEARSLKINGLQDNNKSKKWCSIGNMLESSITSSHSSFGGLNTNQIPFPKRRYRRSGDVAVQAQLYIYALYATWLFTTITRVIQTTANENWYPSLLLMAIFFPLQGFWNCFIYLRPRWKQEQRKQEAIRNRSSKNMSGMSNEQLAYVKSALTSLSGEADENTNEYSAAPAALSPGVRVPVCQEDRVHADTEEPSNPEELA